MSATIQGIGIKRGSVFLDGGGVWNADLTPFDDVEVAEGQRVEIVIGDLTLSGTVITGGSFFSGAGLLVVGGAAGWRKTIAARAYRDDDNGVRLSGVLADLATDTGETIELATDIRSALVGAAWTRAEDVAAECLDLLGYPWRVRPDGVTEVGALATVTPSGLVSLRRYSPSDRVAIVEFPDDEVASVVPGSILDLADDIALTVATAAITITGDTLRARLTG